MSYNRVISGCLREDIITLLANLFTLRKVSINKNTSCYIKHRAVLEDIAIEKIKSLKLKYMYKRYEKIFYGRILKSAIKISKDDFLILNKLGDNANTNKKSLEFQKDSKNYFFKINNNLKNKIVESLRLNL